jgi:hypothetical protein
VAAPASFVTISPDVPFGTQKPFHMVAWSPGTPASSTVGMSGAEASRADAVTA